MRFSLLGSVLFAALAAAAGAKFEADADHADWLYRCGESAVFTVALKGEDSAPVTNGTAEAWLDNFGARIVTAKRTVNLAKENPFKVSGTLEKPGFLRLNVHSKGVKPVVCSAGFEPEGIRQGTPEPADFDAFWAEAKRKFDAEVPVDIRLEPVPEQSNGSYNYWRISTATYGRRVYGWLSEPKDAKPGSCRVVVNVPGAGIGGRATGTGKDYIGLTMNVHSYAQPEGEGKDADARRKAAYEKENETYGRPFGVERYFHAGISKSREDYFYYPVILAINRTVDWLAKNPKADMKRFTYMGGSQGGAFGCMLMALNSHFTKGAVTVPAMTDTLGDAVDGRQEGWPRIVNAHRKNGGEEGVRKWMPYYDACNFAARIRCPVRFAVGFADETCAPHCVYAAYNRVKVADRDIIHGIKMTHHVFRDISVRLDDWLKE